MGFVKLTMVAGTGLLTAACAGSNRFDGGRFPTFGPNPVVRERAPAYPPAPAVPPVGQGLPRGELGGSLPPPVYPGSGVVTGEAPPPSAGSNVQVSDLPPPQAPVSSQPPSQPDRITESRPSQARSSSSLVGTWTARDGTGASCKMTLSSTPSLDLNRASASGCANKDLARVNAWKQQGSEVYLYAAGTVVARMPATGGAMDGVITRSGASVSLSR